ncbi:MAG: hypothetical protein JST92_25445 [Deltaproteobacteria bacterium]|nr:hypothetical protein [Deltaproteobacteria bacterium]
MAEKDKSSIPAKYLDRRVVERYLKKGMVDEKEYQKLLKGLPDLTEQAVKLETEFGDESDLGPTA